MSIENVLSVNFTYFQTLLATQTLTSRRRSFGRMNLDGKLVKSVLYLKEDEVIEIESRSKGLISLKFRETSTSLPESANGRQLQACPDEVRQRDHYVFTSLSRSKMKSAMLLRNETSIRNRLCLRSGGVP